MMQGDDEAVLLKRTAFALVGDADAAEPEVEEPMRAGSGGSGARSHIEVASMEGAAEIGRWCASQTHRTTDRPIGRGACA